MPKGNKQVEATTTEARTYSTNPHIKLRARTEDGGNAPAGTVTRGRKDYTLNLILDPAGAVPGAAMIGFLANGMDISVLGEKGIGLTHYPSDGQPVKAGWIAPITTDVAPVDLETGEKGEPVPTQCVIVRLNGDVQFVPTPDGKVILSATNHVMRKESQEAQAQ